MKGTESQRDGAIVIVVIVVILFVIQYSFSLFPSQTSDIPFGNKSSGPVIVGITGNMGVNGVFYVPEKAKVSYLLEAAAIRNPELFDHRTLDKRLSTGKTAVIESYASVRIEEMNNANKLALGIPININKATIEDLMLVDGIGEKTASQIIQYREKSGRYQKVTDLMNVRGIKEKKFRKLKKYFCTDDML
jgi:competence protein ComEA